VKRKVVLVMTFVFLLLLPAIATQTIKEEEEGKGLTKLGNKIHEEIVHEEEKEEYYLESSPILKEGRVLVSVKDFFSIEDGKLKWIDEENAVHGQNEDQAELHITKETIKVDDQEQDLEVLPEYREGKLFVPLRNLANFFDYELTWDEDERVVKVEGEDFLIKQEVEVAKEKDDITEVKTAEKSIESKKREVKSEATDEPPLTPQKKISSSSLPLKSGSEGEVVKALQEKLAKFHYYEGDIDGIFGPMTRQAVLGFQDVNDISVDGVVGKKTLKTLRSNPQKAPEDYTYEHEKEVSEPPVTQTREGLASWYGGTFHGRNTASGEVFNMHAMTAAAHNIPFGTRVRVVCLETKNSIIVRINDRGPYERSGGEWVPHTSRVIDLSMRAAQELGIKGRGVGPVRLEVLD